MLNVFFFFVLFCFVLLLLLLLLFCYIINTSVSESLTASIREENIVVSAYAFCGEKFSRIILFQRFLLHLITIINIHILINGA